MGYSYLTEAFKKLNLLEDDFNFSSDAHKVADELQAFVADDIDAPEEEVIIDKEADDVTDLQDTYVGKVILECACCHSRVYKDAEDVVISEEDGLANVEEKCPVCSTASGYKVIGKIEAFDDEAFKEEPVEEEPVEDTEDDLISDDEIEEALKEALKESVDDPNCEFKSDKEAIEYWDENHNSDPVLSDYVDEYGANAMEVWLKDSRENGYICNEALTEDLNDVEVKTENGNVDVQKDGDKVTIDFAPESEVAPELEASEEMIAPLDDEDIAELEAPAEEEPDLDAIDEPVEDDLGLEADLEEKPEEEPELDEIDEPVEDEDEEEPRESLKSARNSSMTNGKLMEGLKNIPSVHYGDTPDIEFGGEICMPISGYEDAWFRFDGQDSANSQVLYITPLTSDAKAVEEYIENDVDFYSEEELKDPDFRPYVIYDGLLDSEFKLRNKMGEIYYDNSVEYVNEAKEDEKHEDEDAELAKSLMASHINGLFEGEEVCEKCGKHPCECEHHHHHDDEFECDEFDEVCFEDLCESYLKRVYENVESFKTTSCALKEDALEVSGTISFKNGNSKNTVFSFSNPIETKRGAVVFEGFNKTFSNSKKAFTLRGSIVENLYKPESMIYNYAVKTLNESNNSEPVKVYGRVITNK